jgi:DNA-binding CsgD family transcriptional regulator
MARRLLLRDGVRQRTTKLPPFAQPPAPANLPDHPSDLDAVHVVARDAELVVFSYAREPPAPASILSDAESVILAAILEGRSNAEIARTRRRSVRTVANQVASLFRKLRVRSRGELAAANWAGRIEPDTCRHTCQPRCQRHVG